MAKELDPPLLQPTTPTSDESAPGATIELDAICAENSGVNIVQWKLL